MADKVICTFSAVLRCAASCAAGYAAPALARWAQAQERSWLHHFVSAIGWAADCTVGRRAGDRAGCGDYKNLKSFDLVLKFHYRRSLQILLKIERKTSVGNLCRSDLAVMQLVMTKKGEQDKNFCFGHSWRDRNIVFLRSMKEIIFKVFLKRILLRRFLVGAISCRLLVL